MYFYYQRITEKRLLSGQHNKKLIFYSFNFTVLSVAPKCPLTVFAGTEFFIPVAHFLEVAIATGTGSGRRG